MELGITSVLSLFTLLALSSGVFFMAKRTKIPYTVLLVLVGLLLVPIVQLPGLSGAFGFLDDLTLTPELLFFIFLPILLFEAAFNINIRKMVENIWSIGLLAVVGLIISALLVASAIYLILPLLGLEIPFVIALLFGAIISSTDPVAVIALFKEYGAPKRLSLIFEGESMFNDGTAVALFLVVLAVAENGYDGAGTVLEGALSFIVMVIGGILLGLLMAALFSRAIRAAKSNEFVAVTLLIISAHLVFVTGEMINEFGLFGLHFHVSSIVATTVTALFLGNYTRHVLSPKMDNYVGKALEHLAFVANSLVFVLAGILFASTDIDFSQLWLPILITIVVVAAARAVSVFAVVAPLNKFKLEANIPFTWQKLLAWGSLRGALAIITVLLIPENLQVPGWALAYTPRDLLLALTIGCILATLFVKALTIAPMIRRYNLDAPSALDEAHSADLGVYYLLTERSRFEMHKTRGFVRELEYGALKERLAHKFKDAQAIRDALVKEHGTALFERSLRLTIIDVEQHFLQEQYVNNEVSEPVYRRVRGKLTLQREKIEAAQHEDMNVSMHRDRKDIFDHLMTGVQTVFDRGRSQTRTEEQAQYYRAQMIIARKALKTLREMQEKYGEPVFIPEVFQKVVAVYDEYRADAARKLDKILAEHTDELAGYLSSLAEKSIQASGVRAIDFLCERGIATEASSEEIERRYAIHG